MSTVSISNLWSAEKSRRFYLRNDGARFIRSNCQIYLILYPDQKNLAASDSAVFLFVIDDLRIPVFRKTTASEILAGGRADRIEIEPRSLFIRFVRRGVLPVDSESLGDLRRVDIGTEKYEFPASILLPFFNHLFDSLIRVLAARVFKAVCRDHDKDKIVLSFANAVKRRPDRIQQSRTAPGEVFLFRKLRHVRKIHMIVQNLDLIVEQNSRDGAVCVCRSVFPNGFVKSGNRGLFKSRHRSASVQYKYQLFFHDKASCIDGCACRFCISIIKQHDIRKVSRQATSTR